MIRMHLASVTFWGRIASQCYVNSCRIAQWISRVYTYTSSLWSLPQPPRVAPSRPRRALRWAPRAAQQLPTALCLRARPAAHPVRPSCVHVSMLYVCTSVLAPQIGSLMPSFWIPYICINTQYWFFSFWLISRCLTGSRFIHITTTDSI